MSQIAERRQEEKERRRAEILDAAEAVAAEVGVEAMTMDLVARRARLSRALLYVYFQDKPDLVLGLCERGLATLHDRFAAALARPARGVEQIAAIGRAYVAFAQEFPVYFDALARFEAHAPQIIEQNRNELACKAAGDRVHALTVRAIEHGIADGSIRADVGPPLLVAVTLWGFMHGIIQLTSTKSQALAADGISVRLLVDQAIALCTRSMAGTPS